MILERLLSFIKPYTPRVIPKWTSLMKDLKIRQDILKLRFLNAELGEFPFVLLIEQIIGEIEEDLIVLRSMKDNFSRCMYLMEPRVSLFIEQRVDNIRAVPFFRKTFMYDGITKKHPIEIVIPVSTKDPLMDLPLMNYEQFIWDKVHPIKIWHHDSLELINNFVIDPRVRFRKEPASYGIITIDFIALILKYVNYLDNNEFYPGILRAFLKEEVIIHFHKDVTEIWMINLILELLDCNNEKELNTLVETYKKNDLVLVGLQNYFHDIWFELQQMKDGKVSAMQMLYSTTIFESSVIERVKYSLTNLRVRNLRQYQHNQLLIDLINIKLLLTFISYSTNTFFVKTIRTQFENKINLLLRSQIINQIRSKTVKAYVLEELNNLSHLLKKE